MKNQKGVSLITLVITIIVVIILAAIALGNGVLDLGGRAQFTGFTETMGQIQADITTAVEDASGAVAQAGLSAKSIEQRRNFVARGGDINQFSGAATETSSVPVSTAAVPPPLPLAPTGCCCSVHSPWPTDSIGHAARACRV